MQKTNEKNSNLKEDFNRHWQLYASIAGVCMAFLITSLNDSNRIDGFLFHSLALFSFLLPIFTCFSLFHFCIENSENLDIEKTVIFINSKPIVCITRLSLISFVIAVALFLFNFNTVFGFLFTLSSVIMTIFFIKSISYITIK